MSSPTFNRLVAELIAGTAVPRSMGILGAGQKPWDALYDMFELFGYANADDIEQRIEAAAVNERDAWRKALGQVDKFLDEIREVAEYGEHDVAARILSKVVVARALLAQQPAEGAALFVSDMVFPEAGEERDIPDEDGAL